MKKLDFRSALVGILSVSAGMAGYSQDVFSKLASAGQPLSLSANVDKNKDSEIEELILLEINKQTFKAKLSTLAESHEDNKILSEFPIAYGKSIGNKQVEGDNKTPEGIYFTTRIIDGKSLPPKYGPYAIPINFPNPIDKLNKKTGYGIWLHGEGNAHRLTDKYVTEGCVAFYNDDIEKLVNWLPPLKAVVVIHDGGTANAKEDLVAVEDSLKKWADAWKTRDLDSYISSYDENFRFRGMGIDGYKDYKQRVFNSYKNMRVDFDHVRVVTHPHYAVTVMNQDFDGDGRYKSYGRKVIYWKKTEGNKWRILLEDFGSRPIAPLKIKASQVSLLSSEPSTRISTKSKSL